jgi:hypothetical protein
MEIDNVFVYFKKMNKLSKKSTKPLKKTPGPLTIILKVTSALMKHFLGFRFLKQNGLI